MIFKGLHYTKDRIPVKYLNRCETKELELKDPKDACILNAVSA